MHDTFFNDLTYTLQGYKMRMKRKIPPYSIGDDDMSEHQHIATPRDHEEKERLIKRLKRVEGQVRGIQKMIEEDRYCVDILVQISAIESAMKQVGYAITERHMKHCVSDAIKAGDGNDSIEELMKVLKQFNK